jgi:hypothetical protein
VYARKRASAPFRNVVPTQGAGESAFTHRHLRAGRQNGIGNGIINLVLHRAVAAPSTGHLSSPVTVPHHVGTVRTHAMNVAIQRKHKNTVG